MDEILEKGSELAQTGAEQAASSGVGSWILVDALVVAFILLFALIGAKKGLYNTFMPLVVIVLAVSLGIAGSKALTPVAHHYFYPQVEQNVVERFDEEVETALSGVDSPAKAFQRQWNKLLNNVGIETKEVEEQVTEPALVSQAREELKEKTEKGFNILAAWILFGICTAIGFLFLTIVKNLLGKVSDWPIIKWVDGLGGLAIGALTGLIIFFIIVKACGLFGIGFFEQYAEDTKILSFFTDTY